MTRFILLTVLLLIPSVLLCTQTMPTKKPKSSKKSKLPGETRCSAIREKALGQQFERFIQQNYTATLNHYEQYKSSQTVLTKCPQREKFQSNNFNRQRNTVCKSNVTCSYDENRFPPVLYHVYCRNIIDDRAKFQCENATSSVWVLRLEPCERKSDKKLITEKWIWKTELVGVGCNIKNTPNNTHRLLEEVRLKASTGRKRKKVRQGRDIVQSMSSW